MVCELRVENRPLAVISDDRGNEMTEGDPKSTILGSKSLAEGKKNGRIGRFRSAPDHPIGVDFAPFNRKIPRNDEVLRISALDSNMV